MSSRLSDFDPSILTQPGIDVPWRMPFTHADLHQTLFTDNFHFDQQYEFYCKWYSDYQHQ